MNVTILGIRHHGVGSATHVLNRLRELNPDLIMIEGPPEITEVLSYIGHEGLTPPVAIMVYDNSEPKNSVFYPFTSFSPEWVAAKFAAENKIPIRSLDKPATLSLQEKYQLLSTDNQDVIEVVNKEDDLNVNEAASPMDVETFMTQMAEAMKHRDPIYKLAVHSGYGSGEAWWDYYFERVLPEADAATHFQAVNESMSALRENDDELNEENEIREAYMRTYIRQAQNEMYSNIVVICGAWHGPALQDIKKYDKSDAKLIKSVPKIKIKVTATWIPWTNERLSMYSGYGAGITSPGWYEHLWTSPHEYDINWLVKVAQTFRKKNIDISSAHVIETARLASALAAMRNKSSVTLDELNEATISVMCMGDNVKLSFIQQDLTIADKIGAVPDDIPKVPIQEDFEKTIKTLRLPQLPHEKQYDLDLRKDGDLQRSIFLHRLEILDITWGRRTYSRTKGTFKESWVLCWRPEVIVTLIDKAHLGNTIERAAIKIVEDLCHNTSFINVLADLITKIIPAELYDLLGYLLNKIRDLSTISADIVDLMKAIPSLIDVGRYGNVRRSDTKQIQMVVSNLLTKVFIGLPNACYGLDEAHSEELFDLIAKTNEALRLIDDRDQSEQWYITLRLIRQKDNIHPIIGGCVCRLLLDAGQFTNEEAENAMSLALSSANQPMDVAYWIQGFLSGSGMIIIYDERLWNLVYKWVESLDEESFIGQLPYLRRTFAKFEYAERRQIGEKAKKGLVSNIQKDNSFSENDFDHERAKIVLPTLKLLLIKPRTTDA